MVRPPPHSLPFPTFFFMKLPTIINQDFCNKKAAPDETHAVVVETTGFNLSPLTYQGRSTKTFRLAYDSKRGKHALRVPLSLWMADQAEFARELYEQTALPLPLVPKIEPWTGVADAKRDALIATTFEVEEEKKPVVKKKAARKRGKRNEQD